MVGHVDIGLLKWGNQMTTRFHMIWMTAEKNYGKATGCKGIFRDGSGTWKLGFTYHIGLCGMIEVELYDVFKGILIAWDLGLRCIVVKCDSVMVVK